MYLEGIVGDEVFQGSSKGGGTPKDAKCFLIALSGSSIPWFLTNVHAYIRHI